MIKGAIKTLFEKLKKRIDRLFEIPEEPTTICTQCGQEVPVKNVDFRGICAWCVACDF